MQLPTHADIATHAYHIWEQEGRPDGHDFDHWVRAEQEMAGTQGAARMMAGSPGAAKKSGKKRAPVKSRKPRGSSASN